jgi:magnesium transporter
VGAENPVTSCDLRALVGETGESGAPAWSWSGGSCASSAAATRSPYFHDVYDYVLGAAESVDSTRERIGSILETNLNEQSNDLNEITKKLAAWAAIIAVPTAVTGFYGQNVPYPGYTQVWGFVTSTVVIVVLAGGLYVLLRRRGWL